MQVFAMRNSYYLKQNPEKSALAVCLKWFFLQNFLFESEAGTWNSLKAITMSCCKRQTNTSLIC